MNKKTDNHFKRTLRMATELLPRLPYSIIFRRKVYILDIEDCRIEYRTRGGRSCCSIEGEDLHSAIEEALEWIDDHGATPKSFSCPD